MGLMRGIAPISLTRGVYVFDGFEGAQMIRRSSDGESFTVTTTFVTSPDKVPAPAPQFRPVYDIVRPA
jgi:hypothetical protein